MAGKRHKHLTMFPSISLAVKADSRLDESSVPRILGLGCKVWFTSK